MSYGYIGIEVPCALCNSSDHDQIADLDRDGHPLTTVMCKDCGLVFTQPMPTEREVAQFYGIEYRRNYKKAVRPPLKHTYRAGNRCVARYTRLEPYLKPGMKVLDLGSGGGEFVYLLRHQGIDATGIEPNEGYGEFAKKELGVPILRGTYEKANVTEQSLDIITANHVIEHLINPEYAFSTFAEWLKPGGILNIEVPNVDATYHAPRHRFHFAHVYSYSAATLAAMGNKTEFGCIDVKLAPHTGHINAIFQKGAEPLVAPGIEDAAKHTRAILSRHNALSHWLSGMAIKRAYNNLRRPLREKRALRDMDDPKAVLDQIYSHIH